MFVYTAILRVAIIILFCPILWYLVCESMTCYYLPCWGMCSLWFGLMQNTHLLCQNSKDLPRIAWILSLCHRAGVSWWMGPIQCQWWSWTWTPLRQMMVCLQGVVHKKTSKGNNFKGCGVVIVLVSMICVCHEFLSCITGLDVLDKTLVSDGADGWTGVQEDPVWVNNISCWCLLCSLGYGEIHL